MAKIPIVSVYDQDGNRIEVPAIVGRSAYQSAQKLGYTGSEAEWIESLRGNDGRSIKSIVRTEGDGTPGTTDTYTITYTDNESDTFTIHNGADRVFVGEEADMPAGTRVRVNPGGRALRIPQVDDTLEKPGYAADAKATGDRLTDLSKEIADEIDGFTEVIASDRVTMLFNSDTDEWVNKIVNIDGSIIDNSTTYATPPIDIAGYDRITVRCSNYNDHGNTFSNHHLWIAQYDGDMQFISGSRKNFYLHPINEDGKVYESYKSYDLSLIQKQVNVSVPGFVFYAFGGENTVELDEGARYIVLFNLKTGAIVDMEIFGTNYSELRKRVVSEDNLAVKTKIDDIEEAVFGDIRTVFDSRVDSFKPGSVSLTGTILDQDKKYRLPLIEITDATLVVRVRAYNSNSIDDETVGHIIWVIQYDENYSMIANSRQPFFLHPISDSSIPQSNLKVIGKDIGEGWEGEITPMVGAKYVLIFNFYNGTSLDISVIAKSGARVGLNQKVDDLFEKVGRISPEETVGLPFIGSTNIPLISTVFGSSSTYNTNFAAVAVADLHGRFISLDDANLIRNTYASSYPIFNAGDMINLRAKTDGVINTEVSKYMEKAVKYGVYHTMGQHETGWSNVNVDNPSNKGYMKVNCMTHEEVFQYFIEPMKSVWGLPDLTTNYYYKDFDGMRLISLYQYNIPLYDDPNDNTMYKYLRSSVWLGQEQLNWLIDTLNSTPAGSKVVILMHQSEGSVVGAGDNNNFFGGQVNSGNHIIDGTPVADIVQAFIDKTTISKTYTCIDTDKYTESDFTVTVNGDFTNAQGAFANYISGDAHVDYVGYAIDTKQRVLGLTSSSSAYDCIVNPAWANEARRIISLLGYCYSGKYIKLGRIGQQYSLKGQHRTLDKINF